MEQNETIKLMLVDDHPFVLEGIRSWLSHHPGVEIIGDASNGREAIEKALQLNPHVIVMDISMPVMDGLEATRHLRKTAPDIKVLLLSMHDKGEFAGQIVESGARGYVSKNASPEELLSTIEAIYRGDTVFNSGMTDAFLKQFFEGVGKPKSPRPMELSLREREVLTLVAEGFSNKEAAGVLGVSVRTVEKHRERIMDKLDLHSVVELTKYAIAHQMVRVS